MRTVIDILEEIEATSGSLAKQEILKFEENNELLKNAIQAASDPYVVYYVNKFKMPKSPFVNSYDNRENDDDVLSTFLTVGLRELSSRSITGNDAKNAVISWMSTMDERQQKWCSRILLKNLRCGLQEKSFNKIWPNLIKSFAVQLSHTLKASCELGKGIVFNELVKYPVWVDPKLDGLRCVAIKKNGIVEMYTRNGTLLETLPRIKKFLETNITIDNVVFDGEALSSTGTWNDSVSVVMSKKTKKDDSDIVYHVFDMIDLVSWEKQLVDVKNTFTDRKSALTSVLKDLKETDPVQHVSGVICKSDNDIRQYYASIMNQGYEGVMIKDLNAPYYFKRTNSVLKLKPITTFEGVIVDSFEGRENTKREGQFGGFEIILSNGIITRVGSGFDDSWRAQIGLDPTQYFGQIIEVEGQPDPMTANGLTEDGKIRFPVFSRFRDESDVDPQLLNVAKMYFENL